MKKVLMTVFVVAFVTAVASAQGVGTVMLMNEEVKKGYLPGGNDVRVEHAVTSANEAAQKKLSEKEQALAESAEAQAKLDQIVAYYESLSTSKVLNSSLRESNKQYYLAVLSFAGDHRNIVQQAAESKSKNTVYQTLTYRLEELYESWVAVKNLDKNLATELKNIVKGHTYWVEASQEAFYLKGIANEIHRTFTHPDLGYDFVQIAGEGMGLF